MTPGLLNDYFLLSSRHTNRHWRRRMPNGMFLANGVEALSGNRCCVPWKTSCSSFSCISDYILPGKCWDFCSFRAASGQLLGSLVNPDSQCSAGTCARPPATLQQVLEACPELHFLLDGTERLIQQLKDRQRQQENYSGQKKRHMVKNVVVPYKLRAGFWVHLSSDTR